MCTGGSCVYPHVCVILHVHGCPRGPATRATRKPPFAMHIATILADLVQDIVKLDLRDVFYAHVHHECRHARQHPDNEAESCNGVTLPTRGRNKICCVTSWQKDTLWSRKITPV